MGSGAIFCEKLLYVEFLLASNGGGCGGGGSGDMSVLKFNKLEAVKDGLSL